MKKKPLAEPVIAPEIMDLARQSVVSERRKPVKPCVVCGGPRTPQLSPQATDDEDLCWVCRRLKISAWRDAEQASAQE
jgi:hypothetical protein